jgi:hypothetical protein
MAGESPPPGFGGTIVFMSDTVLVRLLDDETTVDQIFALLAGLGDLQHVDFSYLSFSRSISASYYDTRDAVRVSATLQKLPGISSCISKPTFTAEDRTARIPLSVSHLFPAFEFFGDVDQIFTERSEIKVVFFDIRAKARLIANLMLVDTFKNL